MSRFYVGQRVRVVSCDDPEDLEAMGMIGREGVVDSLDVVNEEDSAGNVGVTIDGDDSWCFWPHELEPVTDSYDKSTWDQCVWKPEHLRVARDDLQEDHLLVQALRKACSDAGEVEASSSRLRQVRTPRLPLSPLPQMAPNELDMGRMT